MSLSDTFIPGCRWCLPEHAWKAWLNPETPCHSIVALLQEPLSEWEAYPISTRVNSPKNEGPELIEPTG
ncbi:MAG: hypothetical protein U5P41_14460 [Gammaproteobacteria bacterium]|nr:hypothetical protein [Gammaproteobacteria bacterium]